MAWTGKGFLAKSGGIDMKQWLATVLCLFAALQLRAATVTIFAAASLTDSLKQIEANYEGPKILIRSR
jgi:ABC-type molybdate transport system substrate-binding protein